jgi:glycosyltransferase involved in cell wall biosynthesis
MLSINIPVFNIEVTKLVQQLIVQAKKLDKAFEIRVYDDGSSEEVKKVNRRISSLPNVVYVELEQNLGRSAIRNKMGTEATQKHLLFIDADSEIVTDNYLELFLESVKPNRVICGGTTYKKEMPADSEKYLRWFYGTNREAVSAEIRKGKKGFIITSNNFLIEKEVFKRIRFREDLKTYGHEDTLLGYDLFKGGVEIFHINNPVEHTGLEDAELFLEKTKTALANLYKITHELLATDDDFTTQVHFLNRYKKITKFIPAGIFRFFYKTFRSVIEKNMLGKSPHLFLFDLYKIGFYSTLKQV